MYVCIYTYIYIYIINLLFYNFDKKLIHKIKKKHI